MLSIFFCGVLDFLYKLGSCFFLFMANHPDLNLASSYIPACLCLLKGSLAFILFIFAPVSGWIGLGCILIVDRLLWNTPPSSILDVNAVCISLVGGLMVAHARVNGVETVAHWAVIGAWALLSAMQVLRVIRMRRSYEILLGACSVTILSCLFEAQERPEFLALRAFAFVVTNIALPYLAVLMQQNDIDTYVNVSRTLLILLCDLEVAFGWVTVFILCLGHQLRVASQPSESIFKRKGFMSPQEIMLMSPSAFTDDGNAPTKAMITSFEDFPSVEDNALLQEALAKHSTRNFLE